MPSTMSCIKDLNLSIDVSSSYACVKAYRTVVMEDELTIDCGPSILIFFIKISSFHPKLFDLRNYLHGLTLQKIYYKQYKVMVGYIACGSALLALAGLVCIKLFNPPGLICRPVLNSSPVPSQPHLVSFPGPVVRPGNKAKPYFAFLFVAPSFCLMYACQHGYKLMCSFYYEYEMVWITM